MTNREGVAVVLVGVGLLVAGLAGGVYLGQQVADARSSLDGLSAGAAIRERAQILYSDGDNDAATEALNGYLKFLDARSSQPEIDIFWLDARGIAFDKMLTYARLALVHERRTPPELQRADDYWRKAAEQAVRAGIKDSSRNGVRSLVERLDEAGRAKAASPAAR